MALGISRLLWGFIILISVMFLNRQTGKIVQMGTHQKLLSINGLYRRMYMRQMGLQELDAA